MLSDLCPPREEPRKEGVNRAPLASVLREGGTVAGLQRKKCHQGRQGRVQSCGSLVMGLRMAGGDRGDSRSRQGSDWPGQRVTSGRTCWNVRVVDSRITKAWPQLRVPPLSCYMTLDKTFYLPELCFFHQQTICGLIERPSLLGWLERYVEKH